MVFDYTLALITGADIPFIEGSLTIHQPTIAEISMIGEDTLFSGGELLKFSKDSLPREDQIRLSNYTDFDILMSVINDKSVSTRKSISCVQLLLNLLFPKQNVVFLPESIAVLSADGAEIVGEINKQNFPFFKEIIIQMFCLNQAKAEEDFNPHGALANEIADKLKQRKQQLARLGSQTKQSSIFSRYISILAVGVQKDINILTHYTVYQLFDEFERFERKREYDMFVQARFAGAKDLQTPKDWVANIHE